jgi:hypothetical protein
LPVGPAQSDTETDSEAFSSPIQGQTEWSPRSNGADSRDDAFEDGQNVGGVNSQVEAANGFPNEPGNEVDILDYEPSDSEINIARIGLTQAHINEEPPRVTRQKEAETAYDNWVQPWRFCRTLYKTPTGESVDPESTVVCLYALCDENDVILHVSISSNNTA